MPEAEWQKRYGEMLERIQEDAPGAKVVVGTISWSGWDIDSWGYERALVYNEWISTEARRHNVLVADLWNATVGKVDGISTPDQTSVFPPNYHGDNFHPNDIGHQRIAETFFHTYQSDLYPLHLPYMTSAYTSSAQRVGNASPDRN
jgi:lysophospholipase L1-like esterase